MTVDADYFKKSTKIFNVDQSVEGISQLQWIILNGNVKSKRRLGYLSKSENSFKLVGIEDSQRTGPSIKFKDSSCVCLAGDRIAQVDQSKRKVFLKEIKTKGNDRHDKYDKPILDDSNIVNLKATHDGKYLLVMNEKSGVTIYRTPLLHNEHYSKVLKVDSLEDVAVTSLDWCYFVEERKQNEVSEKEKIEELNLAKASDAADVMEQDDDSHEKGASGVNESEATKRSPTLEPVQYLLAVGLQNGEVKLYVFDPSSGLLEYRRSITGHLGSVRALAFDPTSTYLAVGTDEGLVSIVTVGDWVCTSTLAESDFPVQSLSFNKDGKILAIAYFGDEGYIPADLVHIPTQTYLTKVALKAPRNFTQDFPPCVQFCPGENILAYSNGESVDCMSINYDFGLHAFNTTREEDIESME